MHRIAFTVVLALVAAGCGGYESDPLTDAAERTVDAGSSRVVITISLSEDKNRYVMEGAFDYREQEGYLTADWASLLAEDFMPKNTRVDGKLEFRFMRDGSVYMRLPHFSGDPPEDKPWSLQRDFADDAFAQLMPFPGGGRPDEVLTTIQMASDKIDMVGLDEVRGARTVHYRATIDPERLLDLVPAAQRNEAREELESYSGSLTIDVWIDSRSRLARRVAFYDQDARCVIELFDFGIAVNVEAPPADQVAPDGEEIYGSSDEEPAVTVTTVMEDD